MHRHRRHGLMILAALLLLTQLALSIHQADLAAHANGDICEWCLASAPLGAALPSVGLALLALAAHVQPIAPAFVFSHTVVVAYRGRGPPLYSA